MQNILSDDQIEKLAMGHSGSNGQSSSPSADISPSGSKSANSGPPSGETGETVFEFTASAESGQEALSKGVDVAVTGVKTVAATRRAIQYNRDVNREARRAKTQNALNVLSVVASFF